MHLCTPLPPGPICLLGPGALRMQHIHQSLARTGGHGVQGNINLIEAAAKKGVKKFVLVTSIGTGDSKDAPPGQVYDVLKPVLLEKEKAEEALKVRACCPTLLHLPLLHFKSLSSEACLIHGP